MKLSKRLQAVATLVDIGSRVIDVGCDHAYLDIFLTLNNGNNCIATDINSNALNVAKSNIKKYKLSKKIKTVLTDGLDGLDIKYDDTIVISGMGTHTILDILNTNKLSNTLIISSNNDIELLRIEVVKLGYFIDSEIFLYDKGVPYIIIKFIKGVKYYKKIDYSIGPILKNNKEYICYLINKNNKVLTVIKKSKIFLRVKYKLNNLYLTYKLKKLQK
ncbi:MAG: class I SAM-dependent methyltransferase [bacterium]|nr:class I SAM-dependent methyltransferase [bacterium]